jgi:hypothetical protein
MTGTGDFGSAVFSSGKRPPVRYCCSCIAPGPVVAGSVPPNPLESTTSAWWSGTFTPSPTLPSEPKPSVAADFRMVSSERLRPLDG